MDCLLSRQFHLRTSKCYSHALSFVKQQSKKNVSARNILYCQTGSRWKQNSINCHCYSSTSEDFYKLISPANKDRVIKNLLSVKPRRFLPLKKNYRQAATLIPMCTVNGELSILYTVRSINLKYGRGEIR